VAVNRFAEEIVLFDHMTGKEVTVRAGRKGWFLLGSSAVQAGVVAALVLIASAIKAKVAVEPVVPVKLIKPTVPASPSVPPAPSSPKPRGMRRRPADVPRSATALIQPKAITAAVPELEGAEEDVAAANDASESVLGGAVGAAAFESVASPPPRPKSIVKDEPAYAGVGFVRPRPAERHCVQTRLQIPRGLEGLAATVTVRFAVGKDGSPSLFMVQSSDPDARLAAAIWKAVRSCRWIPGTNPQGQPTTIWVVMPFRFQAN
jgi:periplasmic protein TonB